MLVYINFAEDVHTKNDKVHRLKVLGVYFKEKIINAISLMVAVDENM